MAEMQRAVLSPSLERGDEQVQALRGEPESSSETVRKEGRMTPIYTPTHRDIDLALESLEIEDERQKEALRRFCLRERQATVVPRRTLLQWAVLTALAGAVWGFGIVWVYPFLHRVMARIF